MLLVNSSLGRPPFLSQQLLESLESHGTFGLTTCMATLANPSTKKAMEHGVGAKDGMDLKKFFGVREVACICIMPNDSMLRIPDSLNVKNGGKEVSMNSEKGDRVALSLQQYVEFAKKQTRADLVVPPYESIGPSYNSKHEKRGLKRTEAWAQDAAKLFTSKPGVGTLLLPVVGRSPEMYKMSAKVVDRLLKEHGGNGTIGVYFANLISEDGKTISERIETALATIETDVAVKFVSIGAANPSVIIDMIRLGMTHIESTLPYVTTKLGHALRFTVEDLEGEETTSGVGLNLRDRIYAEDKSPVQAGCSCFTCQNHTRAYIHHLLDTKEMLGQMLLFTHNLFLLNRLVLHVKSVDDKDTYSAKWKQKHQ